MHAGYAGTPRAAQCTAWRSVAQRYQSGTRKSMRRPACPATGAALCVPSVVNFLIGGTNEDAIIPPRDYEQIGSRSTHQMQPIAAACPSVHMTPRDT